MENLLVLPSTFNTQALCLTRFSLHWNRFGLQMAFVVHYLGLQGSLSQKVGVLVLLPPTVYLHVTIWCPYRERRLCVFEKGKASYTTLLCAPWDNIFS